MWFRFQLDMQCRSCGNGWYVHVTNWMFYECPRCMGSWLGCGCDHGMVAIPREQTRTGAWVIFGAPNASGCVEITNLGYNEFRVQALSEDYPW
jgi:hypothetical protein